MESMLITHNSLQEKVCKSNFFTITSSKLTYCSIYYNNLVNLSLSKLDQRQIGFLCLRIVHREHKIGGTIDNTILHLNTEYR